MKFLDFWNLITIVISEEYSFNLKVSTKIVLETILILVLFTQDTVLDIAYNNTNQKWHLTNKSTVKFNKQKQKIKKL